MKVVDQTVELLWVTPNSERIIERAARVCYKSEDKITDTSAATILASLIKNGHEAMLEHASASFIITTDRGVTHEIVRHRLASYAQESTRYCNYSGDKFGSEISVVRPINLTDRERRHWFNQCEAAEIAYFQLIDEGAKPQIARSVLPTCTKADIVMTTNFREWRHFLKLRCAANAHPQMRDIAFKIKEVLTVLAPNVFQ